MKIQINEQNVVIGYAEVGDLENSVEVEIEEIPDDLTAGYWVYTDGELNIDEALRDGLINTPIPPSAEERLQAIEDTITALLGL